MQKFFEKYIKSFEAKDAIKLIGKHLYKAKELCEENDPTYGNHLATVYDMVEDYFESKGMDLKTHTRA